MSEETEQAGGNAGPMSVDEAVDRLAGQLEGQSARTKPEAPAEDNETEPDDVGEEDTDGSPEGDQAAGSEASESEEDDGSDEGDDDAEGQSFADDTTVRLDDGTETTLGELKRGSMLMADYTRKTQELAEHRRQLEDTLQQLNGYAPAILERLQVADQLAQFAMPQPPDEELRYSDPVEYSLQRQDYQAAMADYENRVALIRQGIQETMSLQHGAQQYQGAQSLEEGRKKLREAIPELNDPNKAQGIVNDILSVAEHLGFSREEVSAWRDPRIAQLAHLAARAAKIDGLKPKVAKKTDGKPPVQKPGKRQGANDKKRLAYENKRKRLAQTGSVDDAIETLLAGGMVKV